MLIALAVVVLLSGLRMAPRPSMRRMRMIAEVGAENNSTTVLMIPSDFVSLA